MGLSNFRSFNTEEDYESALARVDLSLGELHSVFKSGLVAANQVSSLAANTARGSRLYHDSTEQLNSLLMSKRWEYDRKYHLLVSPEGDRLLKVRAGTGLSDTPSMTVDHTAHIRRLDEHGQPGLWDVQSKEREVIFILHEHVGTDLHMAIGSPAWGDTNTVDMWKWVIEIPTLQPNEVVTQFGDEDEGEGEEFGFEI